jgi:hypothetical protein
LENQKKQLKKFQKSPKNGKHKVNFENFYERRKITRNGVPSGEGTECVGEGDAREGTEKEGKTRKEKKRPDQTREIQTQSSESPQAGSNFSK